MKLLKHYFSFLFVRYALFLRCSLTLTSLLEDFLSACVRNFHENDNLFTRSKRILDLDIALIL